MDIAEMRWCTVLIGAALGLFFRPAVAHPVHEIVQTAYLTIASDRLDIELDLSIGREVADTVLRSIDINGDGAISFAEARKFGSLVIDQSGLILDGQPVDWKIERVEAPGYGVLRVEGGVLKTFASVHRLDRAGSHTLTYDNRYQPTESRYTANLFVDETHGWWYRILQQRRSNDGRQLVVTYRSRRHP